MLTFLGDSALEAEGEPVARKIWKRRRLVSRGVGEARGAVKGSGQRITGRERPGLAPLLHPNRAVVGRTEVKTESASEKVLL